jgi:hypothetical protein
MCALLCSVLASQSPACCAEVSAAHSCCSTEHSGCADASVGCACPHDAAPVQTVSAPALPALDLPAAPTLELNGANVATVLTTAISEPLSTRALLALHQRLNL